MNCKSKTKKMEKHKILFYQYPQKKQQHHEELKHIITAIDGQQKHNYDRLKKNNIKNRKNSQEKRK